MKSQDHSFVARRLQPSEPASTAAGSSPDSRTGFVNQTPGSSVKQRLHDTPHIDQQNHGKKIEQTIFIRQPQSGGQLPAGGLVRGVLIATHHVKQERTVAETTHFKCQKQQLSTCHCSPVHRSGPVSSKPSAKIKSGTRGLKSTAMGTVCSNDLALSRSSSTPVGKPLNSTSGLEK
jgi:hypothetical protein